MQWTDEETRAEAYAQSKGDPDREDVLVLAEALGDDFEKLGHLRDFKFGKRYRLQQIASAIFILVTSSAYSDQVWGTLTWVEREMISVVAADVVDRMAEGAASASHKGEADEALTDPA